MRAFSCISRTHAHGCRLSGGDGMKRIGARLFFTCIAVGALHALAPLDAPAAPMPADVINVDFNTSDDGPGGGASVTYSGLAAGPATAGTVWNSISLGPKVGNIVPKHNFGPTAAGTLVNSSGSGAGAVSTITIALTNISQYNASENPAA